MERGEILQLEYRWFGPAWCLSGGRHIDDAVAQIVIKSANVVGVGDALAGATSQTWRWVN